MSEQVEQVEKIDEGEATTAEIELRKLVRGSVKVDRAVDHRVPR